MSQIQSSGFSVERRLARDDESDEELVERIRGGDVTAFEPLMRRHNQRLFRVARGIVTNDTEAEDVVQQTYVSAFSSLHQFAGRARVSTWLTRIAINEGLARKRQQKRQDAMSDSKPPSTWQAGGNPSASPEDKAAAGQLRKLLEAAVDALPDNQRLVFLMREVEGLSTSDTAEALSTTDANVRVTLHRARQELRETLNRRVGRAAPEVFAFAGERCDRIVAHVLEILKSSDLAGEKPI